MIKSSLKIITLAFIAVLFVQCGNGGDFDIAKGKVGKLTPKTTIEELETIFEKDSIVSILSEGVKGSNYFQEDDEYLIFEKGGKHLLTIVPKEQLDPKSTIKSIQIFDDRYKTKSGLNINSNFQEINANNKVSKVETSFSSATLFIDDLNGTIAIDKEQLGLKEFSLQKVSLEQIPDLAKMKSFIIWFN
ncbi:hypothetical protein ACE1MK_03720 [Tenacibaculum maritimum]|uniref:hypothetical protein n=1 Tax=Tenacibaculum maritimum TaxID=107401 RepID=UPI0012E605AF|nr:hypothetical protein [Tenacibaculum maritimum]MCD9582634.1 hypothetical protein [Tenacibaculum maritimum]MCD9636925.1 hypothetical protein [Tenacibaculum maritimum]MDB0603383.1 hypothetical protein [Tenacibaculum maritimum]MDB0613057.1 hypothetical protein [Tenacibaculum maritimum]CAA0226229.1 Probable lipoprotein precursor [Tenacibaculum maritimum]